MYRRRGYKQYRKFRKSFGKKKRFMRRSRVKNVKKAPYFAIGHRM